MRDMVRVTAIVMVAFCASSFAQRFYEPETISERAKAALRRLKTRAHALLFRMPAISMAGAR